MVGTVASPLKMVLLHASLGFLLHVTLSLGDRHSTVATRPRCNGKDVGLNPAAARNENWTLGKAPPCTKGAPAVQQDLSGRRAM